MEHACEKCGTLVEDGVPFCPSCGAPQIRVSIAATPQVAPGAPGETRTPAVPLSPYRYANRVQWRVALPGAALAGVLLAVSMMFPFVSPFLSMFVAGGVAAALYVYRSSMPVGAGQGAKIGAVGGLCGFGILAVLTLVQLAAGGQRVLNLLQQALTEQLARNPDPRLREALAQYFTPHGLAVLLGIGSVVFLVVVLVCSAAGGAAAGALLGKHNRHRG